MPLIDKLTSIQDTPDGLAFRHAQVIPGDFLETLASERHAKASIRAAEFDRVASVPTALWDIWIAQGRRPFDATPREIVAWLRKDGMDAFITTPKRV